jgi:hypothetical protein
MRPIAASLSLLFIAGCAVNYPITHQDPPVGAPAAEITVNMINTSERTQAPLLTFEDGQKCLRAQNYGPPDKRPTTYHFKAKVETLTLGFSSSVATAMGGGFGVRSCRNTFSFEPVAGAKYEIDYLENSDKCGARLFQVSSAGRVDRTSALVKRVERPKTWPGDPALHPWCSDDYRKASEP